MDFLETHSILFCSTALASEPTETAEAPPDSSPLFPQKSEVSEKSGMEMKSTIEVLRIGSETEEVLYRNHIDVISPKWVKARAHQLLKLWEPRNANGVRGCQSRWAAGLPLAQGLG